MPPAAVAEVTCTTYCKNRSDGCFVRNQQHAWVLRATVHCHNMQAMVEELTALNPLTKLRRLHLNGRADDPRLDWLNLGHDVLVMTWSSECIHPHFPRATAASSAYCVCDLHLSLTQLAEVPSCNDMQLLWVTQPQHRLPCLAAGSVAGWRPQSWRACTSLPQEHGDALCTTEGQLLPCAGHI